MLFLDKANSSEDWERVFHLGERAFSVGTRDYHISLSLLRASIELGRTATADKVIESILQSKLSNLPETVCDSLNEVVDAFHVSSASDNSQFRSGLVDCLVRFGVSFGEAGDADNAIRVFRSALNLAPDNARAALNLGVALKHVGKGDEAVELFRTAVALDGTYIEARLALANYHVDMGDREAASVCYQRAFELDPSNQEALVALGRHLATDHSVAGVEYFEHATRLSGEDAHLHVEAANAAANCCDYETSLRHAKRAVQIAPQHPDGYVSLGTAYRCLGEAKRAEANYTIALGLDPNHVSAKWNRSLAFLEQGRFPEGFREYENRWDRGSFTKPELPGEEWNGQDSLEGKTLLVFSEQGLGDSLHFLRYCFQLKKMGATVVFRCPGYLRALAETCRAVDAVCNEEDKEFNDYDYHCGLLSLPHFLDLDDYVQADTIPYLRPSDSLVETWKERVNESAQGRTKVGFLWQGNPFHQWDQFRSVPLDHFRSLAIDDRVQLFSMQQTHGLDQRSDLAIDSWQHNIAWPDEDHDQSSGAFMDTAALALNLDLAVVIDSAVAHLCGALGVPSVLLISQPQDWRWFDDKISRWYPSMRILRKQKHQPWTDLIDSIPARLFAQRTD